MAGVIFFLGCLPDCPRRLFPGTGDEVSRWTVRCNGGPAKAISSAQLIRARGAVDDLKGKPDAPGPAALATQLPPGPGSILRYVVRDEDGTVAFSDTSAHQPKVFFQLAALTRELAQKVCGLPR